MSDNVLLHDNTRHLRTCTLPLLTNLDDCCDADLVESNICWLLVAKGYCKLF
jgi:hypothetical protein